MTIMYKGIHFENVEDLIEYQEQAEGLKPRGKKKEKEVKDPSLTKEWLEILRKQPIYPSQQPFIHWKDNGIYRGPSCANPLSGEITLIDNSLGSISVTNLETSGYCDTTTDITYQDRLMQGTL